MTKEDEVYKCNICGNVVSVNYSGVGELVCCGKPMENLKEKTAAEEGKEKHIPVVEIEGDKVKVTVGSVEHPMEQKHHITLIQLMKNGKVVASKRLYAGEKPVAEFCCVNPEGVVAREVCNVHGLWKS